MYRIQAVKWRSFGPPRCGGSRDRLPPCGTLSEHQTKSEQRAEDKNSDHCTGSNGSNKTLVQLMKRTNIHWYYTSNMTLRKGLKQQVQGKGKKSRNMFCTLLRSWQGSTFVANVAHFLGAGWTLPFVLASRVNNSTAMSRIGKWMS